MNETHPIDADTDIAFRCNICGAANIVRADDFHRERPNCSGCGSTPRFRGIVLGLSLGLYGKTRPLSEFTTDKSVAGVGMSEWDGYALPLAERFDFTNTFFHTTPRLDVLSDDWMNYRNLDFLISSEVFEHVLQPIEVGFRNMRRMLKDGGTLVFSTPFNDGDRNIEHFPGMVDFATCQIADRWVVVSKRADGGYDTYDEHVVFHGGPGTVLEMRIFGRSELLSMLASAGFEASVLEKPVPEIGYYWPLVVDRPEFGRIGLHHVIVCRAV